MVSFHEISNVSVLIHLENEIAKLGSQEPWVSDPRLTIHL